MKLLEYSYTEDEEDIASVIIDFLDKLDINHMGASKDYLTTYSLNRNNGFYISLMHSNPNLDSRWNVEYIGNLKDRYLEAIHMNLPKFVKLLHKINKEFEGYDIDLFQKGTQPFIKVERSFR